ncbi:MAG: YeeE/YedE family protein [Steroidobacteraceae bacterium]
MNALVALLAGLLFGAGLLISGMSDPQRVLGFLDVAGRWNPALAFTMGGAIAVAAPAYWLARRRGRAACGEPLPPPAGGRLNVSLWLGSALFGMGWGLAGICPGPALLLIFSGGKPAWVFAVALAAGMYLQGVRKRIL